MTTEAQAKAIADAIADMEEVIADLRADDRTDLIRAWGAGDKGAGLGVKILADGQVFVVGVLHASTARANMPEVRNGHGEVARLVRRDEAVALAIAQAEASLAMLREAGA